VIVDSTRTVLLTSALKTLHRADAGAADDLQEEGWLTSTGKREDGSSNNLFAKQYMTKDEKKHDVR
jgi:hypothetical protein